MVERLTPWQEIMNRILLALGHEPWFFPRVRIMAYSPKNTVNR